MSGTGISLSGAPAPTEGLSAEYLFLLFVIGCVVGFVVETIYCFLVGGKLESRKGMIYGPFSQIYGFGAVLLTVVLLPLASKGLPVLFIGSALLGGLFEAACSVFQEQCFGTVSWDYSKQKGSLFGGRTSVLFMLYWGVMGSAYIYLVHPTVFALIGRIPEPLKGWGTMILFVLLSANLLLSCIVLHRWEERRMGLNSGSASEQWLDKHFPDARLESIYPHMTATRSVEASAQQGLLSDKQP